ncbi:hypothetical protein N0V93_007082 [Gnomoniopsis smithogilvyi]|uniref:Acyl-protein thioesterase 1 n=1 Tax=Gnomoniopsis smithogilvyi TaxID=1191159 RepID=A0A9W8YQX6_9PEZI|nr:hypothetical protein N0V93_007082 [Gnomoniopsis smithogilvyi]
MATQREPVVLPPLEPSPDASTKSSIIFLHGLGDDGRGTGYGLAQQFQIYEKLPQTKWVLPTANIDPAVGQRCWYKPHDLPSPLKPKVPGHDDDQDAMEADDEEDEEGILRTVEYIDSLVTAEVEDGVDPRRIVVGGFSQGCAVSMVWGLKGTWRDKVGGVFGLSGYFPKVKAVMPSPTTSAEAEDGKYASKWFFGHGLADQLVSTTLFADGQKRLQHFIPREHVEGHVYEGLGHDVGGGEIRDFWLWLKMVFQE